MIPIRRYPYTDFHDLNLDYLLKQIAEFEEDLEELKRRVKILEDWKIIIDGDITTIKGDITTIKGDIVTIKGDIVDIKSDIVDIQGDIITINNTIDDHSRRITDLEKETFGFELHVPASLWQPSTVMTDFPYEAELDFSNANIAIADYQKFIDGDYFSRMSSNVRLEFYNVYEYIDYSDKLCSYVETGNNNIVHIYASEPIDRTLHFYAYVTNV